MSVYYYDIVGMISIAVAAVCLAAQRNRSAPFRFRQIIVLLVSGFCCALFDCAAGVMAQNHQPGAAWYNATYALSCLAIFSMSFFPYCLAAYAFEQLNRKINKIALLIPPAVLTLAALVFNRQSGILFSLDDATYRYRYGPLVYAVYAIFFAYALIIAVECYRKRRYMSELRITMLLFLFSLILARAVVYIFVRRTRGMAGGDVGILCELIVIFFHVIARMDDPLTGLKNANGFSSAASHLLDALPDGDFLLEIISVYQLQMLNGRFGYNAGNALIIEMGRRLEEKYKGVPSALCRLDGAAFAVLVRKRDFKPTAAKVNLSEFLGSSKYEDYIASFFCGVYPVKDKSIPIWRMIKRARYALGTVYGSVKNHAAWFDDDMERSYIYMRDIGHKINTQAIAFEDFRVVLQPIVDAQTGKVCSAEALVRWHDKERGVIPPSGFIPIFESTGYITTLDLHVVDAVCAMLADMKKRGIKPVPISVNISRVDIDDERLAEKIAATVDAHGIEHSLVRIEITESAFSDASIFGEALAEFRDKGFSTLVDDFGSGYSNLAALQKTRFDIIKLDMELIRNVENSDSGRFMFKAIARFVNVLRLPAVVEGVETKGQYEFVKSLGCDMVQGYYFSKPLAYEDFVKLLERDFADGEAIH